MILSTLSLAHRGLEGGLKGVQLRETEQHTQAKCRVRAIQIITGK